MSCPEFVSVSIKPVPKYEVADLVDVAKQVQDRNLVVAQFSLEQTSKLGAIYTLKRTLGKVGLQAKYVTTTNLAWPKDHIMSVHTDATPAGAISTHFTSLGSYKALFIHGPFAQKADLLKGDPELTTPIVHTDSEILLPASDAAQVSSAWLASGGPQSLLLFTESAHQFTTTVGPRRSMSLYYALKV